MGKLKFALALLGAGSVAVIASEAQASTTVNLDVAFDGPTTDISLIGGAPAQFYYGEGATKIGPGAIVPDAQLGAYGSAALGLVALTPGLPTPAETFSSSQVKVGVALPDPSGFGLNYLGPADAYVHLTFTDSGTQYIGTAHVDGGGALRTIEYVDVPATSAAPEPAEWALLIGGLGLAGGALRRRRQAAAAA